jgi:ComF family protein
MKMICNFFKAIELFVFPKACLVCEAAIYSNEWDCCAKCLDKLPIISEEQRPMLLQNIDHYLLNGLYAYLWFNKKGMTQEILHQFKYRGQLTIGKQLTKAFVLRNLHHWENQFDYIIPIPMHPLKQWFRGYNQAHIIAEEISLELHVPIKNNVLIKKHTLTVQAKLNKIQRELHNKNRYQLAQDISLKGKRILLVDDVYTTGSTLYNCAELLKQQGATTIVAATLVLVK